MRKGFYITVGCLILSLGVIVLSEASRRSWPVHTWLSVVSHGHLFHHVVHTSQPRGPIPSHYPVHTMESQQLVYSGSTYLGYLSKNGFFVPDGSEWEPAMLRDLNLVASTLIAEVVCGIASLALAIALVTRKLRKQPTKPPNATSEPAPGADSSSHED